MWGDCHGSTFGCKKKLAPPKIKANFIEKIIGAARLCSHK